MTAIVDIQNIAEHHCPKVRDFIQWADAALQQLDEPCELSIRIVDEQESAMLNSTYRGKSGPTNVLSFPFESPVELIPRLLGDLVICAALVEKEATEQGKAVRDHWAHLVVHGCLHLLGYDHVEEKQAQEMETLEIEILQSLAIGNPYQGNIL